MATLRMRWATAATLAVLIVCVCSGIASVFPTSPVIAATPFTASWTVEPLATPVGAQHVVLRAVSCAEATACMAVGYFEEGTPGATPLAETWNGSRWSLSGAVIASTGSHLLGVSCPVSGWCASVGGNGQEGFAETWNGTAWTKYTIAAPPGSQSFTLLGVSCTSPNHCLAVGYYVDDTGGYAKALVEEWNGSTWTEGNAVDPNPRGAPYDANSELYAISCASPTSCVAVGEYEDEPDDTHPALAENWNGSTWTVDSTPTIPHTFQTYLNSVSCWAPASCMAVGGYNIFGNPPPEGNTVSENWDGSVWQLQSAPVLPETFNELHGVSCTSATFCIGLGYGSPGANYLALWSGAWSYEPFGTALDSVSCVSETYCLAVGGEEAALYVSSTKNPLPSGGRGSENPSNGGSPSPIATESAPDYVALGDSYSAGQGNPPYLAGTDTKYDQCHRSTFGYPFQVSRVLGLSVPQFTFHACSGAVISDFFHGRNDELSQLSWLSNADTLVSLTIGGNDAYFAKVMATCVFVFDCELIWKHKVNAAIAAMAHYSPTNPESLQRLYMMIAAKASRAKIVVLGYPRFFPVHPPLLCPSEVGPILGKATMLWINSEIRHMDGVIKTAVIAADRVYPRIVYADTYNAFTGHEICTSRPDMYGVRKPFSSRERGGSFHPNQAGQQVLAAIAEAAAR
jgi:hypothetical protein